MNANIFLGIGFTRKILSRFRLNRIWSTANQENGNSFVLSICSSIFKCLSLYSIQSSSTLLLLLLPLLLLPVNFHRLVDVLNSYIDVTRSAIVWRETFFFPFLRVCLVRSCAHSSMIHPYTRYTIYLAHCTYRVLSVFCLSPLGGCGAFFKLLSSSPLSLYESQRADISRYVLEITKKQFWLINLSCPLTVMCVIVFKRHNSEKELFNCCTTVVGNGISIWPATLRSCHHAPTPWIKSAIRKRQTEM